MARWIKNIDTNDPYIVGDTIIAGWWPSAFYRVMTWKIRATFTPVTIRDYFVTTVQKTDRHGFAIFENPHFETEYSNRTAASKGHVQIVSAMAQGKRSPGDLERCTYSLKGE